MANLIEFPRRKLPKIDCHYASIKQYEIHPHGQCVNFCRGEHKDGRVTYAIILMAAEGSEDAFGTIAEYKDGDGNEDMVGTVAAVAARTLYLSKILVPEAA